MIFRYKIKKMKKKSLNICIYKLNVLNLQKLCQKKKLHIVNVCIIRQMP